ncbi:MAG: cytochrome c3 family protein [Burkholderiaceae bacterium]
MIGTGHIPTLERCESCHTTRAFVGARFRHLGVLPGNCISCHNGLTAEGKPAAHPPTQDSCDNCHRSGASWAAARVDHNRFNATTVCGSCHNGRSASAKNAAHIPDGGLNCGSCHSTRRWSPTTWNHTQTVVVGQCTSCHSGAYPPATGRPANHVPVQAVAQIASAGCDACHRSTSNWLPARVHDSFSIATDCQICHNGAYAGAEGKPNTPNHVGVTTCQQCHNANQPWSAATFAHSPANAVGTGTCDSCHNGSTAVGKPASHIPTTPGAPPCDTCHRSQTGFTVSVTMDHAAVAATSCKNCHSGAFASQGASAKPANHIPESQLLNGAALDCNACHRSTTNWSSMSMNHNGSQGSGADWCKGCHLSGSNYLGDMQTRTLTHRRSSTGAIDCSTSGCHRPLGNEGQPYREW